MSFLLDTNVVSEWVKPSPNPGVVAWMAEIDEDQVFLSVVSLTELRYGVERMPSGKRQKRLNAWLQEELPLRFEGRILTIDRAVADACGKLVARSEAVGRPIKAMDAFIAATAEVHQLTLVTRNVSDFQATVSAILNPWTASRGTRGTI
jgi:predicted nucleic acid-binding protein